MDNLSECANWLVQVKPSLVQLFSTSSTSGHWSAQNRCDFVRALDFGENLVSVTMQLQAQNVTLCKQLARAEERNMQLQDALHKCEERCKQLQCDLCEMAVLNETLMSEQQQKMTIDTSAPSVCKVEQTGESGTTSHFIQEPHVEGVPEESNFEVNRDSELLEVVVKEEQQDLGCYQHEQHAALHSNSDVANLSTMVVSNNESHQYYQNVHSTDATCAESSQTTAFGAQAPTCSSFSATYPCNEVYVSSIPFTTVEVPAASSSSKRCCTDAVLRRVSSTCLQRQQQRNQAYAGASFVRHSSVRFVTTMAPNQPINATNNSRVVRYVDQPRAGSIDDPMMVLRAQVLKTVVSCPGTLVTGSFISQRSKVARQLRVDEINRILAGASFLYELLDEEMCGGDIAKKSKSRFFVKKAPTEVNEQDLRAIGCNLKFYEHRYHAKPHTYAPALPFKSST